MFSDKNALHSDKNYCSEFFCCTNKKNFTEISGKCYGLVMSMWVVDLWEYKYV